ncbi:MAG: Mpo1-like protein [Ideonella sp.]
MRNLVDQLSQYADYHRDARNVATHFVGIPMIVVGVAMLLSRPMVSIDGLGGVALSPALAVIVATSFYYLALDLRFGIAMTALLGLSWWAGHWAAAQQTGLWLGWGLGLFIAGWAIQFVGHVLEGRKPAFVDDLIGLVIGPLFLVAEAAFAIGLRGEVHREIANRLDRMASPKRHAEPTPA